MKSPGGRPTKYNADMLAKAQDYVVNYADHGDAVPTVAGLACELQVTKSTVYLWGETHKQFSDTLDAIQQAQERKLASGGLDGSFQPTIAKLMLANHGYHEKQQLEHSGDLPAITIKVVNGTQSD